MEAALSRVPLLLSMTAAVALAMLLPASHAVIHSDYHVARAFFYSSVFVLLGTGMVAIVMRGYRPRDPVRANLTALVWAFLWLPVVMALPMTESLPDRPLIDMWFEMISSFSSTGATVFDSGAPVSPSLHLWRAVVGWMGGLVILTAAVSILAPVNLGGMEVLSGRVPGRRGDGPYWFTGTVDPMRRVLRTVARLLPAYAGVTVVLWLGLILAGDNSLTAFCHALSSVSASGISPVGGLTGGNSGVLGEVMILLVLVTALSRRFWPGAGLHAEPGRLTRDPELQLAFLVTGFVAAFLFLRHAFAANDYPGFGSAVGALWGSIFTTVSFMTTTGFVSTDWEMSRYWSGLETPGLVLAGLAVMGGGVATTAGGVKLLRVYALFRHGEREMERLIHPNSVGGSGHSARRLRREGAYAAWVFFMLFALSIALGVGALTVVGMSFESALMLAISALTTTGTLAELAAESPLRYGPLAPEVKAILGGLMIVGRLETLAVLVFLIPDSWKGRV